MNILSIKGIKSVIWFFYKPLKYRFRFRQSFKEYNRLTKSDKALKENLYPCLYDATLVTPIEPVYFLQDSWAFEKILNNKPLKHIDVGSGHKFVSFLSKITHLTMVDIRPLEITLPSIHFVKGDILKLPFEDSSIDSLSSLCVIEHIGLGRYGDKLNPQGSEMAFSEINRVLKTGADFYFSVPVEYIGKIYFNAHRSFSENRLFSEFLPNYEIKEKKYIYNNELTNDFISSELGIGCYHVKKIK